MSVEIRKREAVTGNHLVIISNDSMLYDYEDIQNRITAIIDAIRNMDEHLITKQTIYPLLDILVDYLPTDEQCVISIRKTINFQLLSYIS